MVDIMRTPRSFITSEMQKMLMDKGMMMFLTTGVDKHGSDQLIIHMCSVPVLDGDECWIVEHKWMLNRIEELKAQDHYSAEEVQK